MRNLLLYSEMTETILLVIMICLIVSNLVFIILFILGAIKNNELEATIHRKSKIDLSSERDKVAIEPNTLNVTTKVIGETKIKEAPKEGGWYVVEKGTKEAVAYTTSKEEAKEIVKTLKK